MAECFEAYAEFQAYNSDSSFYQQALPHFTTHNTLLCSL
jgi:hypothetical protein